MKNTIETHKYKQKKSSVAKKVKAKISAKAFMLKMKLKTLPDEIQIRLYGH